MQFPKSKRSKNKSRRWAEGAVIYQIYPRSFQDSNGDGVGDLNGVTSRLGYLKDLGINAIWLSPFFKSPMADFGYDVSDYRDVDPIFGSLKDFKKLLKSAHKLDIKVIVDIVPNHTSDEHLWFKHSSASKDNKYSDWYVWKDSRGEKSGKPVPPNNWVNLFDGKSAWRWSSKRRQFYLHSFHAKQPDLNWRNPKVREAMKDVLRFWLDLGVDGFRVDAVPFIAKHPGYLDDPANPDYEPGQWPYMALHHDNSQYWPDLYNYLDEMAAVLKEKRFAPRPRFMVTEGYPPRKHVVKEYMQYYLGMDTDVAAPFIFEGIELPWKAARWKDFLEEFHTALDAVGPQALASYAFGNHDQRRLASHLGATRARAAAVLALTLPGMIFIYYGEEIGMHNVKIPKNKVQDPGAAGDLEHGQGRDPYRTPMQWTSEHMAGFTTADDTWLPIADDYERHNVALQDATHGSLLHLYKQLISIRNGSKALKYGNIIVLKDTGEHILAYERTYQGQTMTTVINFSNANRTYNCDHLASYLKVSSNPDRAISDHSIDHIQLAPYEAVIIARPGS